MARIVNQILTQSKTQGFSETGKQIEELSKKQTRLANDSTNTGRQFASQASGLGGLVAAYAGAAATTFALQQSFSALSAAARSQALVEGVNSLAQSLGQNGNAMIATLKEITRGQLSVAESAQNIGIALSAGLGKDQVEQLADIATRASKTLGRDLTDSIQRLVRGVGKLEPELLDELGIFTRIEPAVERYAAKLGRAASSLTNFERRQAFANAVIEEGASKYRNVDTSVADSSQNLNKLAANLTDLATKIGQVIVNIFDPLISFLNKDISNLAGLLVLLGTLVFSKLGQVTKQGIDSLKQNIDTFAANVTSSFTKSSKSAELFTGKVLEAQKAALAIPSLGGFAGPREESAQTRAAIRRIREGNVAPSEIPGLQAAIKATMAREQALGTPPAVERLKGLTGLLGTLDDASKAASPRVTMLGTAITSVGNAVSWTAGKLGSLLGLLGRIAVFYSVIDFFATLFSLITGKENPVNSVLVNIGKFFADLVDKFTKAKQVNDAFIGSFSSGDAEIKKGATSIESYNKALDLATEGLSRAAKASKVNIPTVGNALTDIALVPNETEADETNRLRLAKMQEFDNQMVILREKFNKAQTNGEREVYHTAQLLLEKRRDDYFNYFEAVVKANGKFTEKLEKDLTKVQIAAQNQLGVSFSDSLKLTQSGLISFNEKGELVVGLFDKLGEVVGRVTQSLDELDKEGFRKIAAAAIVTESTFGKLSTALGEPGISANNLSGFLVILENQLKSLDDSQIAIYPSLSGFKGRIQEIYDTFSNYKNILVQTERAQKEINDTFGASIKLAGSLIQSGITGVEGFAFTSEQQKTNQLYFLQRVGNAKVVEDLTEKEAEALAKVNKLIAERKDDRDIELVAARGNLAIIRSTLATVSVINKAFLGEYISFSKTVEELYKTEQKRTVEIQNQARVLTEQNYMAYKQQQEEQRQLEARIAMDKKRLDLELATTRATASEKRYENSKLTFDLAIEENERVKQRLELEQQLRDVQAERNKLAMAAGAQPGLLAMERELTLMRTFGGLGGQREQEALELQKQIREKEVEIAQSYQDIKLASEKNLSAATLDKGSAELKIEAAKLEKEIAENRAKADRARIQAEHELRKMELDDKKKNFDFLKSQATDTYNSTLKQIDFDEKMFKLEMDLLDKRNEQINKQAEIFKSHTDALAKIFGLEVGGRRFEEALRNLGQGDPRPNREEIINVATAEFSALVKATTGRVADIQGFGAEQRTAMGLQFGARRAGATTLVSAQRSRYDAEIAAIDDIKKKEENLRDAKLAVVKLEEDAAKKRAQNAADAADYEKAAADLRYNIRQTELQNERERLIQTQDRQKAELALLRELAKLKGDNIFLALSDSVEIFREKTSDFITTMLTDVINGTKSARDVFRQFLLNLVLDIQKTMVRRLISEPITDAFGGVLSAGLKGLTGGIAAGITPMTSGVTGIERTVPTTGLFGTGYAQNMGYASSAQGGIYAIGGHVRQMAPGGYVGKRDSVPALLEPGEFVIRRPAAMAIGGQTLNQMNATGQVGGGNVMVNVNNQGTPQTVSGTPKISRQGENLVVDIIVKDIQNNGPIRQTLKGMR